MLEITVAALALLTQQGDSCLSFVSKNLAKGNGNWFTYYQISDKRLQIREGDVFVYDIYLDPKNPVAKGGADIEFDNGPALRDRHPKDQSGLDAHGDAILEPAVGNWYTRRIPLEVAKGRTTRGWALVFEGDLDGRYVQFIDNISVEHADGTREVIYDNGAPTMRFLISAQGYTQKPSCAAVERSKVSPGADLEPLISYTERIGEKLWLLRDIRNDVNTVRDFVAKNPDKRVEEHLREAEMLLRGAEENDEISAEDLQAVLHAAKNALSHTHPAMTGYTGHLVGHAHIDLQWLWEWQEGIVFSRDTFIQAVKFMDEYPGFTFSQSSSALYKAMEEHYPDVFALIKEKVKKGQWEIVGGRVCEGDTNMISPESHARHFLYGQSYFREKFGKTAVVGWEPDTFGHTIQMPQILKLGGCDYYYFCRAGKGKPLFWWEGLDGTRILAFEEPATGSWYNSDVSYSVFKEMLEFEDKTGSKDMLWVYGVGNHGGGPTREHIEQALKWMKSGYFKNVRFSTASEFFKKLRSYDLSKIPTINEELNPVFDGCYTTHSEVKQLNRNAEALTTSAEAVATAASMFGFAYPKASFRRNWEDICFNHHHDTLPGSGIHAPYENTKIMLQRVIADDKDIINRALQLLSIRVTPKPGGISVLVFNPTGWMRSGWIETYLVQSGWAGDERLNPTRTVAVDPAGGRHPVVLLDSQSKKVKFWAESVPSFGYRVFHLTTGSAAVPDVTTSDSGFTFENANMIVSFDKSAGVITRMYDKKAARDLVPSGGSLGRPEIHLEGPGGMSAWVIGNIRGVEKMSCDSARVFSSPGSASVAFTYTMKSANNDVPTVIKQTFTLEGDSSQLECVIDCDWQNIGSSSGNNPMLRIAFDTAFSSPKAFYDVPFGAIERPLDGKEYPALQWADVGDTASGLAVINDSKHGYSAKDGTLRLTLIRCSYSPDPVPDRGVHKWKYAIAPHAGNWLRGDIIRKAVAFNQPMMAATVPFDARGANALEWSAASFAGSNVIPTALKRAEKDAAMVIRMYAPAASSFEIALPFAVKSAAVVNFLEDQLKPLSPKDGKIPISLRNYEISTVKVHQN